MGLFSFNSAAKTSLPWISITSVEQLKEIIESSSQKPILIFKHSARCGVSSAVKSQFESSWTSQNDLCEIYYLDLLAYRAISNEIERITGVEHQSPQAIVMDQNKVIYAASHSSIDATEIENLLKTLY